MEQRVDYISDFIYYIKVCPKPIQAFPNDSLCYELAKKWIRFLCDYDSPQPGDKVTRNFYLWHLVACLQVGELVEPFLLMPNEKLEPFKFFEPILQFERKLAERNKDPMSDHLYMKQWQIYSNLRTALDEIEKERVSWAILTARGSGKVSTISTPSSIRSYEDDTSSESIKFKKVIHTDNQSWYRKLITANSVNDELNTIEPVNNKVWLNCAPPSSATPRYSQICSELRELRKHDRRIGRARGQTCILPDHKLQLENDFLAEQRNKPWLNQQSNEVIQTPRCLVIRSSTTLAKKDCKHFICSSIRRSASAHTLRNRDEPENAAGQNENKDNSDNSFHDAKDEMSTKTFLNANDLKADSETTKKNSENNETKKSLPVGEPQLPNSKVQESCAIPENIVMKDQNVKREISVLLAEIDKKLKEGEQINLPPMLLKRKPNHLDGIDEVHPMMDSKPMKIEKVKSTKTHSTLSPAPPAPAPVPPPPSFGCNQNEMEKKKSEVAKEIKDKRRVLLKTALQVVAQEHDENRLKIPEKEGPKDKAKGRPQLNEKKPMEKNIPSKKNGKKMVADPGQGKSKALNQKEKESEMKEIEEFQLEELRKIRIEKKALEDKVALDRKRTEELKIELMRSKTLNLPESTKLEANPILLKSFKKSTSTQPKLSSQEDLLNRFKEFYGFDRQNTFPSLKQGSRKQQPSHLESEKTKSFDFNPEKQSPEMLRRQKTNLKLNPPTTVAPKLPGKLPSLKTLPSLKYSNGTFIPQSQKLRTCCSTPKFRGSASKIIKPSFSEVPLNPRIKGKLPPPCVHKPFPEHSSKPGYYIPPHRDQKTNQFTKVKEMRKPKVPGAAEKPTTSKFLQYEQVSAKQGRFATSKSKKPSLVGDKTLTQPSNKIPKPKEIKPSINKKNVDSTKIMNPKSQKSGFEGSSSQSQVQPNPLEGNRPKVEPNSIQTYILKKPDYYLEGQTLPLTADPYEIFEKSSDMAKDTSGLMQRAITDLQRRTIIQDLDRNPKMKDAVKPSGLSSLQAQIGDPLDAYYSRVTEKCLVQSETIPIQVKNEVRRKNPSLGIQELSFEEDKDSAAVNKFLDLVPSRYPYFSSDNSQELDLKHVGDTRKEALKSSHANDHTIQVDQKLIQKTKSPNYQELQNCAEAWTDGQYQDFKNLGEQHLALKRQQSILKLEHGKQQQVALKATHEQLQARKLQHEQHQALEQEPKYTPKLQNEQQPAIKIQQEQKDSLKMQNDHQQHAPKLHHEQHAPKLHPEQHGAKLHHEQHAAKLHHEQHAAKLHHEQHAAKLHHEQHAPNLHHEQQSALKPQLKHQSALKSQNEQHPDLKVQHPALKLPQEQNAPKFQQEQHAFKLKQEQPVFKHQHVQQPVFKPQNEQQSVFRAQREQPVFRTQHEQQPVFGTQHVQQPNFKPQNEQPNFKPQNEQQSVFRAQREQQPAFKPQNEQQSVFRAQREQQPAFKPQNEQQPVFKHQNEQQPVFKYQHEQHEKQKLVHKHPQEQEQALKLQHEQQYPLKPQHEQQSALKTQHEQQVIQKQQPLKRQQDKQQALKPQREHESPLKTQYEHQSPLKPQHEHQSPKQQKHCLKIQIEQQQNALKPLHKQYPDLKLQHEKQQNAVKLQRDHPVEHLEIIGDSKMPTQTKGYWAIKTDHDVKLDQGRLKTSDVKKMNHIIDKDDQKDLEVKKENYTEKNRILQKLEQDPSNQWRNENQTAQEMEVNSEIGKDIDSFRHEIKKVHGMTQLPHPKTACDVFDHRNLEDDKNHHRLDMNRDHKIHPGLDIKKDPGIEYRMKVNQEVEVCTSFENDSEDRHHPDVCHVCIKSDQKIRVYLDNKGNRVLNEYEVQQFPDVRINTPVYNIYASKRFRENQLSPHADRDCSVKYSQVSQMQRVYHSDTTKDQDKREKDLEPQFYTNTRMRDEMIVGHEACNDYNAEKNYEVHYHHVENDYEFHQHNVTNDHEIRNHHDPKKCHELHYRLGSKIFHEVHNENDKEMHRRVHHQHAIEDRAVHHTQDSKKDYEMRYNDLRKDHELHCRLDLKSAQEAHDQLGSKLVREFQNHHDVRKHPKVYHQHEGNSERDPHHCHDSGKNREITHYLDAEKDHEDFHQFNSKKQQEIKPFSKYHDSNEYNEVHHQRELKNDHFLHHHNDAQAGRQMHHELHSKKDHALHYPKNDYELHYRPFQNSIADPELCYQHDQKVDPKNDQIAYQKNDGKKLLEGLNYPAKRNKDSTITNPDHHRNITLKVPKDHPIVTHHNTQELNEEGILKLKNNNDLQNFPEIGRHAHDHETKKFCPSDSVDHNEPHYHSAQNDHEITHDYDMKHRDVRSLHEANQFYNMKRCQDQEKVHPDFKAHWHPNHRHDRNSDKNDQANSVIKHPNGLVGNAVDFHGPQNDRPRKTPEETTRDKSEGAKQCEDFRMKAAHLYDVQSRQCNKFLKDDCSQPQIDSRKCTKSDFDSHKHLQPGHDLHTRDDGMRQYIKNENNSDFFKETRYDMHQPDPNFYLQPMRQMQDPACDQIKSKKAIDSQCLIETRQKLDSPMDKDLYIETNLEYEVHEVHDVHEVHYSNPGNAELMANIKKCPSFHLMMNDDSDKHNCEKSFDPPGSVRSHLSNPDSFKVHKSPRCSNQQKFSKNPGRSNHHHNDEKRCNWRKNSDYPESEDCRESTDFMPLSEYSDSDSCSYQNYFDPDVEDYFNCPKESWSRRHPDLQGDLANIQKFEDLPKKEKHNLSKCENLSEESFGEHANSNENSVFQADLDAQDYPRSPQEAYFQGRRPFPSPEHPSSLDHCRIQEKLRGCDHTSFTDLSSSEYCGDSPRCQPLQKPSPTGKSECEGTFEDEHCRDIPPKGELHKPKELSESQDHRDLRKKNYLSDRMDGQDFLEESDNELLEKFKDHFANVHLQTTKDLSDKRAKEEREERNSVNVSENAEFLTYDFAKCEDFQFQRMAKKDLDSRILDQGAMKQGETDRDSDAQGNFVRPNEDKSINLTFQDLQRIFESREKEAKNAKEAKNRELKETLENMGEVFCDHSTSTKAVGADPLKDATKQIENDEKSSYRFEGAGCSLVGMKEEKLLKREENSGGVEETIERDILAILTEFNDLEISDNGASSSSIGNPHPIFDSSPHISPNRNPNLQEFFFKNTNLDTSDVLSILRQSDPPPKNKPGTEIKDCMPKKNAVRVPKEEKDLEIHSILENLREKERGFLEKRMAKDQGNAINNLIKKVSLDQEMPSGNLKDLEMSNKDLQKLNNIISSQEDPDLSRALVTHLERITANLKSCLKDQEGSIATTRNEEREMEPSVSRKTKLNNPMSVISEESLGFSNYYRSVCHLSHSTMCTEFSSNSAELDMNFQEALKKWDQMLVKDMKPSSQSSKTKGKHCAKPEVKVMDDIQPLDGGSKCTQVSSRLDEASVGHPSLQRSKCDLYIEAKPKKPKAGKILYVKSQRPENQNNVNQPNEKQGLTLEKPMKMEDINKVMTQLKREIDQMSQPRDSKTNEQSNKSEKTSLGSKYEAYLDFSCLEAKDTMVLIDLLMHVAKEFEKRLNEIKTNPEIKINKILEPEVLDHQLLNHDEMWESCISCCTQPSQLSLMDVYQQMFKTRAPNIYLDSKHCESITKLLGLIEMENQGCCKSGDSPYLEGYIGKLLAAASEFSDIHKQLLDEHDSPELRGCILKHIVDDIYNLVDIAKINN